MELAELCVDFPGFIRLNHEVDLMTHNTAAKLIEMPSHFLWFTRVKDELAHTASRDHRYQ